LVVAALFFFPGVAILFQRGTLVAFQQSFRHVPSGFMVLSEDGAHIFGVLAIVVSLVIVCFYFYLRRAIARDEGILQRPRWR
jgi:drug/metabolite transporter (DMT)-like permease